MQNEILNSMVSFKILAGNILFLCPATKKVAGYYVIPSEIFSVRPSISQRPHHSSAQTLQALLGWSEDMHIVFSES